MPQDENLLLLGEIKGQIGQVIQNQKHHKDELDKRLDHIDDRFDKFDHRLRTVEQRAAVTGAFAGGLVSIGIALAVEKLKLLTGMR